MIIGGICLFIIGLICYLNGDARSNDVDAIMNDFFDSGVVDDGSDMMTLGIVLIVAGLILIVVGTILTINKPTTAVTTSSLNTPPQQQGLSCTHCGTTIDSNSRFCIVCGKPLLRCSHCGEYVGNNASFCSKCGHPISNSYFCEEINETTNN